MPMSGKSVFFEGPEYQFPKPLIEINGKSMVQLAIDNFGSVTKQKNFIFIVSASDCTKYHIDNVLELLTDMNCRIVRLNGQTKGAACSALAAIEYINNNTKLIVSNSDQIIEEDINDILYFFEKNDVDAGIVCFETVHPRWSFVRLDESGKVIEAAEKRPISKHGIAGFYYFKRGSDFVRAAMRSIEKDANVEGLFYIAPTINELVLENKNIRVYMIENDKYHTFYAPQKIQEYEKRCAERTRRPE
jgi:dTDP-glucose pyrophosphorylase